MLPVIALGSLLVSVVSGFAAPDLQQASASSGRTVPPTETVAIDVVSLTGTGCPTASVSVVMAADNSAFTVSYKQLRAQVGGGATTADARRNCQLALLPHIPTGVTYAIAKVEQRGSAHLATGASGTIRQNYYFDTAAETAFTSHTVDGATDADWKFADVVESGVQYAPCNVERNLLINREVRVSAGTSDTQATNSLSMLPTPPAVGSTYQLTWRACS